MSFAKPQARDVRSLLNILYTKSVQQCANERGTTLVKSPNWKYQRGSRI